MLKVKFYDTVNDELLKFADLGLDEDFNKD